MLKLIVLVVILITSLVLLKIFYTDITNPLISPALKKDVNRIIPRIVPSDSPEIILQSPPLSKILPNSFHVYQTFNNCGPAALSMALSYYGINASQHDLGQTLRPYQVAGGDNDDKSVTLEELGEKSKEYGLIPYHRPNGDIELIKKFITYDIPVIARTWTKINEDIGHYRVIKGYGDNHIFQDDSLQGKNLKYSFEDFNNLWKKFNYEYLVLVPKEKIEIAETILGENLDLKKSWKQAVKLSEEELLKNPDDIYARFNLSVANYNIGEYQKSTEEFEKVENKLPFRTLWYQIEPIKAYFVLGNYRRVFEITNRVLNYHNRAFSELYFIRGNIYLKQEKMDLAKKEFEKAILYNVNLKEAKKALDALN